MNKSRISKAKILLKYFLEFHHVLLMSPLLLFSIIFHQRHFELVWVLSCSSFFWNSHKKRLSECFTFEAVLDHLHFVVRKLWWLYFWHDSLTIGKALSRALGRIVKDLLAVLKSIWRKNSRSEARFQLARGSLPGRHEVLFLGRARIICSWARRTRSQLKFGNEVFFLSGRLCWQSPVESSSSHTGSNWISSVRRCLSFQSLIKHEFSFLTFFWRGDIFSRRIYRRRRNHRWFLLKFRARFCDRRFDIDIRILFRFYILIFFRF